jgi:hypothetical protein
MATPAGDRQRLILLAVAISLAALGAGGWRVISGSRKVAARPLPTADLRGISSFLAPLSDTASLAQGEPGTMVVNREPFLAPGGIAQTTRPSPLAVPPKDLVTRGWVVSSILFEDTRRSAIVDNQWVSVGDGLAGGARVTAIERKHVVVTDANGVRHVVPIKGGNL